MEWNNRINTQGPIERNERKQLDLVQENLSCSSECSGPFFWSAVHRIRLDFIGHSMPHINFRADVYNGLKDRVM